ncbi:MAG: Hydroxypyruvate isomerase [uncultured Chloroflexi bacterium]|uniref:Hydroxypyruvate isomerase n=1 Tax=uncultured Chloroflexota bacterium TaxID=166587 RepID=A0A6J4JY56_9CHLR|nr:MAG: Hydroxypyruvate isomerase [uncultured Chloroflexota bacterium]
MPTLSVCVEMVFRPLPFLDRLEAVAKAGYPAFEFWGWQDKDMPAIHETKDRLGLKVAGFGVRGGTLLDPANHASFVETLGQAAEWARKLDCPNLIVTTGNTLPDVPRERQLDDLHRGLEGVAKAAQAGGVTAVVEPLNSKVDHKGYFLDHGPEAFQLIDEIANLHLRVLYDIYHMQIMDGDIIATIEANLDKIGHFHVADVPGRNEPGTGELNYANVFRRIDATGYRGFVGLEYRPSGDHAASLDVVRSLAA